MTDDRRLEIERRFDGETGEPGQSELPDDLESRAHLDRLQRLRELARRHDPASLVSRRTFPLPDRRSRRVSWWLAVAATAAAAVAAFLFRPIPTPDQRLPLVQVATPPNTVVRSPDPIVDRPPVEVELYGWANTPSRAPEQAARLVLGPVATSRKRSPADEILALELANTSLQPRNRVQRFAVSKSSRSTTQAKPGHRIKSTLPEV